jgi:hypothetical protein
MIDQNFLIIYSILIIFLFAIIILAFYILKIKKKLDLFFKEGNKDLGEVLTSQIQKLENQGKDINGIFQEIEKLNQISKTCFQKIGVIRFNPFKEVGGDQSFSIALLDAKNNGFIITSLFRREGNRVFAKTPVSEILSFRGVHRTRQVLCPTGAGSPVAYRGGGRGRHGEE